jgi:hypothetical protein
MKCITDLAEGLGLNVPDQRMKFYCSALDDLTPVQIEHGFEIARRNLGTFLPSVEQLRQWSESWRPAGFEMPVPSAYRRPGFQAEPEQIGEAIPENLRKAAIQLRVSHEEIAEWLEAGKAAQKELYAKLAEDPEWQELYAQFGKPGLTPRPSTVPTDPDERAAWAKTNAGKQGWR